MKLSSLSLEAFFAVSKILNFSKAAELLGITQSALSQRILNLEDQLTTKLFVRERGGTRLTESGQMLARYCQTQSALEEEVLSRLNLPNKQNTSILSGTIRIGGFSSVLRSMILPRLQTLMSQNSNVKIELFNREISDLPSLLKSGQADFIVLDQKLEQSNIDSHQIAEEENVLVEAKTIKNRKHVFLDHDPDDRTTQRFFELQGKQLPKDSQRSYLDEVYGILDAVSAGWGRAVLPLHLIQSRANLRVLPNYKPLKVPIVLHYYQQPYYSQLFQETLRALTNSKKIDRH